MGLTDGRVTAILLVFLIIIFTASPVFAQQGSVSESSAVSLTAEISRLEKLSAGNGGPSAERLDAFLKLIRLHQLSGDSEAALGACGLALAAFPGEGRLLLEQGRLFISLGEFDRAEEAVTALQKSGDSELLKQGRLLAAKLEAFRSVPQALGSLADDPEFAEFKNDIYYTLWKLTGLTSWKDRLAAEFPRSPEAKIAAGSVNSSPGPLWLLFPGRDSVALSAPASPAVQAPPPAPPISSSQTQASQAPVSQTPVLQTSVLQTGLFGREENAKALAERLQRAGFEPQISPRTVNDSDFWAVTVSGGSDMNATIKRLKDAGFEAFPIKT